MDRPTGRGRILGAGGSFETVIGVGIAGGRERVEEGRTTEEGAGAGAAGDALFVLASLRNSYHLR